MDIKEKQKISFSANPWKSKIKGGNLNGKGKICKIKATR